MEYNFREIEKKWQLRWQEEGVYKVGNHSSKPKYYVLDMFPYPSGAGLHVGHPLGYIASDIFARYKRLKGFNVLHPMGYDAFGLPAEQYAIEHGIHPATSTAQNIANFRKQLNNLGFCFDWSREVRTSDPQYYKWTQWIFLQLFKSRYNHNTKKAESIDRLTAVFEAEGNRQHPCPGNPTIRFTAEEWNHFDEKHRQDILMEYRLIYCGYGEVNWCEALGTVLANDEVVNGVSERGGYPVVKKKLRQWYLRITDYADRLLEGLEQVEFSEAMKEMQTNWIGKSYGANITFPLQQVADIQYPAAGIEVYTTRPDTIFGVDFLVLAPEHELVAAITAPGQRLEIEKYIDHVNSRSERERMAEKRITGCFTGAYVTHPFSGEKIPVWISEYVLAGYGTGAIMAVPCGDERDHKFANHFNIPITNIIGAAYNGVEANPTKDAILENSDFLNGMIMRDATEVVIERLEAMGAGSRKVNYKMRDAAFSRQRYWGEPIPIIWKNGIAYPMDAGELPLELPHVERYGPGPEGEGPLANIASWTSRGLETNTMPGYAGSSWYFLRYMDPENEKEFCSRAASDYWGQVDLYIGGTEHAVGHLLYSRMWTKVLYDLGYIGHEEPYRKLVNQGMITGTSELIFRLAVLSGIESQYNQIEYRDSEDHPAWHPLDKERLIFYSADYLISSNYDPIRIPINFVEDSKVNLNDLRNYNNDFAEAVYVTKAGFYLDGKFTSFPDFPQNGSSSFYSKPQGEKMSKSKLNTVNPDDIVEKFGADTFRMYEMFLGPVEMSKPWDTKGIEGVHRFLKKLWRLFADEQKGMIVTIESPNTEELKVLHRTIKKTGEDTERFSFNTAVSQFMICVNELSALKCHKKDILEPLLILLAPYAPHISEELWHLLGNKSSILNAAFPEYREEYLIENTILYPIAINGKTRTEMSFATDAGNASIEKEVLQNETVQKWLEGRAPKKVIIVKGRMVNVVV